MRRNTIKKAAGCLLAAGVMVAAPAGADTTVRVDGDDAGGWLFNPDPANATSFEFVLGGSLGYGSLKAGPIGSEAAEKFIAALPVGAPAGGFGVAYDFKIGGSGTAADAGEFYVNVYANVDDSENFYDCRFDYVATTGSTTNFASAGFSSTDTPTAVTRRGTNIAACPATLQAMPEGSHVRAIALNMGDTGAGDVGLVGYLDNVRVTTGAGVTTYDFEVAPPVKDACKDGGWAAYGFTSQGSCVSSLQANANAST